VLAAEIGDPLISHDGVTRRQYLGEDPGKRVEETRLAEGIPLIKLSVLLDLIKDDIDALYPKFESLPDVLITCAFCRGGDPNIPGVLGLTNAQWDDGNSYFSYKPFTQK
jgi:hypothetical protein